MSTIAICDAFVLPHRFDQRLAIYLEEDLLGVYVNSANRHVIFTDAGLDIYSESKHVFIKYTDISQISAPGPEDRDLDVLVENENLDDVRRFAIPILGITNNYADIFELYNFLVAVTQHLEREEIRLKNVGSREDLIHYLRIQCEWEEYTGALANYLEREFDPDSFTAFDIDKEMVAKPDFWRALAVLLDVPIHLRADDVREPEVMFRRPHISED